MDDRAIPTIVVPDPRGSQEAPFNEEVFREEVAVWNPFWLPPNIQFFHDIEWRNQFWSIEYARSGRSYFWNSIGILMMISSIMFYYWRFR